MPVPCINIIIEQGRAFKKFLIIMLHDIVLHNH
jgi:hypothetical protein